MPTGTLLPDLRAVLFDVDGTLIDSLPGVIPAIGDTAEIHLGVRPEDAAIRALIGVPLRGQFATFGGEESRLDAMVAECIERIEALSHLEGRFEAAIDTLALAHRRGLRTALVTSKSAPEIVTFLERFPGADHIDTVVCASDVLHPKPDPEAARLACARLGVEPHQAAMIGDAVYDLRCARGAGTMAIAVTYGAGVPEALAAERPDLTFDSPEALLAWADTALPDLQCPVRS